VSTMDADQELKARHRSMWASGDYPSMVETFLLPLGPVLVQACDVGSGQRVLDVAAGTGNASIPAAERGAAHSWWELRRPEGVGSGAYGVPMSGRHHGGASRHATQIAGRGRAPSPLRLRSYFSSRQP
jgi:hypothetical protein